MAITIVSGNLNNLCNAGQFEADRSTWGVSDGNLRVVTRSNVNKSKGLFSALSTAAYYTGVYNGDLSVVARCNTILGGRYLAKCKIFVPSGSPIAGDALTLSLQAPSVYLEELLRVDKTVLEAKDNWVQLELYVKVVNNDFPYLIASVNLSDVNNNMGGQVYIDEFEIYQFIGDPDEDPEPEPEPEPEDFDEVFFSKNPVTLSQTAPEDWEDLVNCRLYNDVRIEDITGSGVYTSKLKVELPPDTDGSVTFYTRQAFRGVLTAIPPVNNLSEIVRLTDRIKLFKYFTGVLENDSVTPDELVESSRLLVLLGGISKLKFPNLNFFTSYLPTNKKFMSWAPVEKLVDRLQEDFLNFWVYNSDIITLKLNIKVYFDDGTNETQVVKTITPVAYGQLYQIPTGPSNCSVAEIDDTKNIFKYELSLLDQTDVLISEVRTYLVAQVRHPLTRFFMFLNSLGSYEVLRFTGQAEFKTEFSREVVQRFLAHDYSSEDGEFEVNNVTLREKVNYSTGFFTGRLAKEWQVYMKDLLLSSRIFDITDGDRIPVTITSSSLDGGLDHEFIRFARVDVQKSFIDESFTPDDI